MQGTAAQPQLHQMEEAEEGGIMGLGCTLHAQGMKMLLPRTACASHSP